MWNCGILRPEMTKVEYVSVIKPGAVVLFTFDDKRLLGVVTHSTGYKRGWRATYVSSSATARPEDVPSFYTIMSDSSVVEMIGKRLHRIIQKVE